MDRTTKLLGTIVVIGYGACAAGDELRSKAIGDLPDASAKLIAALSTATVSDIQIDNGLHADARATWADLAAPAQPRAGLLQWRRST